VDVAAAASDAGSGVALVRFYVDGALIATDASAPYSTNWNTVKVAKGQHTLTAVGRDTAGNSATSSLVVVTVT
jgi:hypothetical protein